MEIKYKISLVGIICALAIISCTPPKVKEFTHRNTLFPLKGIHMGIHCRECHKDGAMTSLPTACISCHPMGPSHTQNLGDCDLCHTPTTFATAFFNHRRAGVPMYGAHLTLIGDGCFDCHSTNTYTVPGGFTCSNCHSYPSGDAVVHTSATIDCSNCHNQVSFLPGKYPGHINNPTAHAGRCSSCHNDVFGVWTNVKWQPAKTTGACGDCHANDYDTTEDDHNPPVANDYNCGASGCHSQGSDWD